MTDNIKTPKALIELLAKSIVDHPEHVKVSEVIGEQTILIKLHVAKSDLGQVIGKQGRMAESLRTILVATCTRLQKRYVLEIVQ